MSLQTHAHNVFNFSHLKTATQMKASIKHIDFSVSNATETIIVTYTCRLRSKL